MERNNFFLIVAISITIAITLGSLISLKNTAVLPRIQVSDKIIHSFAYTILTLSWLLVYSFRREKLRHSILILFLVFLYGIIIEILQSVLTTYRQADFLDIVANLVGVVLAFISYILFLVKKR